jgi:hypothetical protein
MVAQPGGAPAQSCCARAVDLLYYRTPIRRAPGPRATSSGHPSVVEPEMTRLPAVPFFILVALLAACGRQEPPKPDEAAPLPAAAAMTTEEQAFLALLPVSSGAAGWSRVKEPRRFSQADLWEYIDGAAEAYLAFGFQELATAGYAHAGTAVDATVDLFRMADRVGAFGVFAQERATSCADVAVGVDGCYAGGALAFWSGSYFVKLTAFKDTPETRQSLAALAATIAPALGPPGSNPSQIGWFPPKNLVPRSVKYVPKDVLGQSYLTNAFEAQYKDGTHVSKLTVMAFESVEAAMKATTDYRAFIGTGGKVTRELKAPGNAGFAGADSYYGTIVAARSGSSVAIAVGGPSEKAAVAQIEACFARMRGPR